MAEREYKTCGTCLHFNKQVSEGHIFLSDESLYGICTNKKLPGILGYKIVRFGSSPLLILREYYPKKIIAQIGKPPSFCYEFGGIQEDLEDNITEICIHFAN